LKKVNPWKKVFFLLFLFSSNFDLLIFNWFFFYFFFCIGFFQVEFIVVVLQNTLILNFFSFFKMKSCLERRFANHTSLGCYYFF